MSSDDLTARCEQQATALVKAEARLTAMTEHRDALAELLERERNALARLRAKHGQACSRLAVVRRALAGQRGRDYEKTLVRAMALRCGLEDPDTFKMAQRDDMDRYGLIGPHRGTGRTTRMLLEALVALEAGCEVEIVMADQPSAVRAEVRLEQLRERAGSPDRATARYGLRISWVGCGEQSPRNIDVRLVDHAAQEASGG